MPKTKAKPKADKACKCMRQVSDQLKEKTGAVLVMRPAIDFKAGLATLEGPFLSVEWSNKPGSKARLPTVLCAYCPFCGKPKP